MVRNYKKKTQVGTTYTSSDLQAALQDVRNGKPLIRASLDHGVSARTLRRHRDHKVKNPGIIKLGRYQNALPLDVEQELAAHVTRMSKFFHGLSSKEVRKLAYDLAVEKDIANPFNSEKGMAGVDWLNGFLARHKLSIRVPEATSVARMVGFNRSKVSVFYKIYKEQLEKHNYAPQNIHNMDESGFGTVQKPTKVVAQKGARTVGKATSAERGQLVTVICSMNATGSYTPPMFVFPRKNLRESLMVGAPPGSVGELSDSGWTNDQIFIKWLAHFASNVGCSKEQRCLLILDGHGSHKTLAAINFCRENGIDMIALPPHCTHKMQPLDRTFFKPVRSAYNSRCDNWMLNNAGKRMTIHNVAGLFGSAFLATARASLAVSGFRSCGIWPFNPDIFTDEDFLPSVTTEEEQPLVEDPNEFSGAEETLDFESNVTADSIRIPVAPVAFDPTQASTSSAGQDLCASSAHNNQLKTISIIQKLSPLPKLATKRPRTRPSDPAKLLTSTPEKLSTEAKEQARKKPALMKKLKTKSKKKIPFETKPSKDEDTECLVCGEDFCQSREREVWVQCSACGGWSHELCTMGETVYVCHDCLPE